MAAALATMQHARDSTRLRSLLSTRAPDISIHAIRNQLPIIDIPKILSAPCRAAL